MKNNLPGSCPTHKSKQLDTMGEKSQEWRLWIHAPPEQARRRARTVSAGESSVQWTVRGWRVKV